MILLRDKRALFFILWLLFVSAAIAEQNEAQSEANSKTIDYRVGQVWKAPGGATVTILLVEDIHKSGKVVHVRVDNIPIRSCGGFHLTTSIDHIALTEKMLRKSPLDLLEENAQIPDSYLEGYREWEKQKKHVLLKQPIQDEILRVSRAEIPIICNLPPNRT